MPLGDDPQPPGVPLGLRPSRFAARPWLTWSFGSPAGVGRCFSPPGRGWVPRPAPRARLTWVLRSPTGFGCCFSLPGRGWAPRLSSRWLSWSFCSPAGVGHCFLPSGRDRVPRLVLRGPNRLSGPSSENGRYFLLLNGGSALSFVVGATPWRLGAWTWGGSWGDFGLVLIRVRRDQRSWIVSFRATRRPGPEAVNPPAARVSGPEGPRRPGAWGRGRRRRSPPRSGRRGSGRGRRPLPRRRTGPG